MRYLSAFALLTFFGTAFAADPVKKPNVVFILADDLGWGDLGCYGNTQLKTPNLDALATGGKLFTHFYVGGSVCSPSRCAFMTGQFPARHKIHGHYATSELNAARGMSQFLDPKTVTVPKLLTQAGYTTAHIGKWHLGSDAKAPSPAEYGFDMVKATTSNADHWKENPAADPFFRAKSSKLFVDEGIAFMEASQGKPFYLQLWMLLPHATLNPTAEQLKPFDQLSDPTQPHKSARQVYYASLTDLDDQVGRLMKKLDELKLADNTLVVFSSDNGPEEMQIRNAGHSGAGSPGPFRGRKRSLYEGGIRVPFIVRWPAGIKAGKMDDSSVMSGADLLPTLAKLAGVEVPKEHTLDGEDRSAVLTGGLAARTNPLYWDWRFNIAGPVANKSPMLAMRDGKWKLLMNPDGSRVELYDIPADPEERKDRSETQPEVVKGMSVKLLAWRKTLPDSPTDPDAGKNHYPWPKEK